MKAVVTPYHHSDSTRFEISFGGRQAYIEVAGAVQVLRFDFVVWMLLLFAMRKQYSIELDAPTSVDLSFSVDVMQQFLSRHLDIRPIRVTLNSPASAPSTPSYNTIIPFSGGVDSCFTLLYYQRVKKQPIDAVFLALGLDMFRNSEFVLASKRCSQMLGNTRMFLVKTDYRKRFAEHFGWRLHSDFCLAALLHIFGAAFQRGLISGGGDGGVFSIRQCFAAPFLNERLLFLFSSESMRLDAFDGANHTRMEKLAFISDCPLVQRHLRVCWRQGKHFNCGRCPKCVLTQLGFIAATGVIPPCFPTPLTQPVLKRLLHAVDGPPSRDPDSPRNKWPRESSAILLAASRNHVTHPLLDTLAAATSLMNRRQCELAPLNYECR